jgi:O-antigen ligase
VRFAHNLPLETWAELGAAGGALILVLYAGSTWLVWSRRGSPAAWLLGPAVLGFLVANLFDWPWHLPASGAVFALSLGALAGTVPRRTSAPGSPQGAAVASAGTGPPARPVTPSSSRVRR